MAALEFTWDPEARPDRADVNLGPERKLDLEEYLQFLEESAVTPIAGRPVRDGVDRLFTLHTD
jgi:hypothetical protein